MSYTWQQYVNIYTGMLYTMMMGKSLLRCNVTREGYEHSLERTFLRLYQQHDTEPEPEPDSERYEVTCGWMRWLVNRMMWLMKVLGNKYFALRRCDVYGLYPHPAEDCFFPEMSISRYR